MASDFEHRYLMSGLLAGWDWFDNGLQNIVRSAGYQPLNKTQSMMVLYISAGVQRPIEIARKMRLSRQAIRHIGNQLIALGMLRARPDPTDGRSVILAFTSKSSTLREFAEDAIRELERVLRSRIGNRKFTLLSEILDIDWGEIVSDMEAETSGRRKARGAVRQRFRKGARSRGDVSTGERRRKSIERSTKR